MRIVVAMSGGVDSSATAALLKEQGHEVIGLAMKTHALTPRANRACCTPDDMRDARAVADFLDIPFYVLNYADVFAEAVIKPFVAAYQAGQTPNPCVACNDKVKFRPLLERAALLGADKLATGHYARIIETRGAQARYTLQRARDSAKDQAYFLYRLAQDQLSQLMFPLGEMTKDEVRGHARRLGLKVADKSESQEICFVGAEGYAKTVERISGMAPRAGAFVDKAGNILGQHPGVHHFTLGQRKGLGVAAREPLYVTHIDAANATVQLGVKKDLLTDTVVLRDIAWAPGRAVDPDQILFVQQRHRQVPRAVRIVDAEEDAGVIIALHLRFIEPNIKASPGQAAVIFDDDRVLGGGTVQAYGTQVIAPIAHARPSRASLPVLA